MPATKAQVKAQLKDLERAYMRRRSQMRAAARAKERKVASEFAAEAERIGKDHGLTVDAKAVSTQTGGGHSGYGLDIKIK